MSNVRKYLILILIAAMLIVPVFAQTVTYSAPAGKALAGVTIASNEGTTGTVTFKYNDGTTTSGAWSYQASFSIIDYTLLRQGEITLGSDTATENFLTPGKLYVMFSQSGNNYNLTGAPRMLGSLGQNPVLTGFISPTVYTTAPASPLVGYTFTADKEVTYTNYESDYTIVKEGLESTNEDWINKILTLGKGTFWTVFNFISDSIYWTKFFFVDNLALILALFFAFPMAFAAKNSKGNPERFIRQYFATLKGFFNFIISMFKTIAELIGTIIGWFKLV